MFGSIPVILLLTLAMPPAGQWADIDRSLTAARKKALAPVIAKQLLLEKVVVIGSFRYHGWSIIHVGTYTSDDRFLFYSTDPIKTPPITEWGGSAAKNETDEINAWVVDNAKGIPAHLAAFFAWYVTHGDN